MTVLKVTRIRPGSAAELAGLKSGDIIAEVNRKTFESVDELGKEIQSSGGAFELKYTRGDMVYRKTIESDSLGATLKVTSQVSSHGDNWEGSLPMNAAVATSLTEASHYSGGKSLSKFVSFLGWVTCIIGAVVFGFGVFESGVFVATAANIVVMGLIIILLSHISRAILDMADNSRRILNLLASRKE